MFGFDYPVYGQSKIYFVTNVGQDRDLILDWLRGNDVEVLDSHSIFGYIEIVIETEEMYYVLGDLLQMNFKCGLIQDA